MHSLLIISLFNLDLWALVFQSTWSIRMEVSLKCVTECGGGGIGSCLKEKWLFMLLCTLGVSLCSASSLPRPAFRSKTEEDSVATTASATNKTQNKSPNISSPPQKRALYNCDFWPDNIWLSFLHTHWLLTLHSKWNMAHFTGINEAPPCHQLRSRRRHGANKHSQFKRAENKSSTMGGPWSWARAVIDSPVPPAPNTHPHPAPTVSISLQLCHANTTESANIKD